MAAKPVPLGHVVAAKAVTGEAPGAKRVSGLLIVAGESNSESLSGDPERPAELSLEPEIGFDSIT